MKTAQFYELLKKATGVPVAYAVFGPEDPPFPYITYQESTDTTISARDRGNSIQLQTFTVDLFDTKRNLELEDKVIQMFKDNDFNWSANFAQYVSDIGVFVSSFDVAMYSKLGE